MTAVCEIYEYRLEHFYQRSFKEGGVTFGQLSVLFEHAQKREADRYKFQAMIHGAKAKDAPATNWWEGSSKTKEDKSFMFSDPADYENMPIEERKALTEKMMQAHKRWADNPLHPRGKIKFKNA